MFCATLESLGRFIGEKEPGDRWKVAEAPEGSAEATADARGAALGGAEGGDDSRGGAVAP